MNINIRKCLGVAACCICSGTTWAATATEKAERNRIDTEYRLSLEKCGSLAGNPRDVCKEQARADRAKAEAKAKADKNPSVRASRAMQEKYAEADYKVAKVKCAALTGNEKDVCRKEAATARITAIETAKANKDVADRKAKLAEAKNEGAYDVAKERCDSYSGPTKDRCLAEAKLNHGK